MGIVYDLLGPFNRRKPDLGVKYDTQTVGLG